MPGQITPTQVSQFHSWINSLSGGSSSGIFGWLYSMVPSHGRYAGNGNNDVWVVWQAFNNVFGDGSILNRNAQGIAVVQNLINNYMNEFPDDPLGIAPRDIGDWNAFFHDLFSGLGLLPDIYNNLVFAWGEVNFFRAGADIFHAFSGPFIAIFGTAANLVSTGVGMIFTATGGAWDIVSDFGNALYEAWHSVSEFDFVGAVGDFINGVRNMFDTFLTVVHMITEEITPVVLDLDGDGVELISLQDSRAVVDFDGDGVLDRVGWVSPNDGILGIDLDGDGFISGITEFSFADPVNGFRTDLEGLHRYDTNHDNVLDQNDLDYHRFLIWQDIDGDGVCDAGEARTMAEAGIASIALALNGRSSTLAGHNVYNTTTWTSLDGTSHEVLDVGFLSAVHQSVTRQFEWGSATIGADGIDVSYNGAIDLSAMLATLGHWIASGHTPDWSFA